MCRERRHHIRDDEPFQSVEAETRRGITAWIELDHYHAGVNARAACRQPSKHPVSWRDKLLSPDLTDGLVRVDTR